MSGGPMHPSAGGPKGVGGYILFAFGALGLLGAMFTDVIAVIGRQIGMPFLGSVEMAQICVVLVGATALVVATGAREHASVRVITERLGERTRGGLERVAHLTSAAFFALLLAGSVWIAWELRDGAERTELLLFPVMLLRIYWIACASICVVLFIGHALRRRGKS